MTSDPTAASHGERPLVLDSRRLHRQPGSSLRLSLELPTPAGLSNDVIGVPPDRLVTVDLMLESVLDGIWVSGESTVPVVGACVRCLDPIERDETVTFQQFFVYPDSESHPDADGDDDVVALTGHLLDLEPAFRDAVLLALPLSPTCRPDCPGLCPECGQRLADEPEHEHTTMDPRWAGLAEWPSASPAVEGE